MSRILPVIVLLFAAFATMITAQEELITVEVQGYVRNEEYNPVAGVRLEVSYTKVTLDEDGITITSEENVSLGEASTDELGFYTVSTQISSDWQNFEIKPLYINSDTFIYRFPEPKVVDDLLLSALQNDLSHLQVDWQIRRFNNWQERVAKAEEFGRDSDRSRLIRDWGMPDKVNTFMLEDQTPGEMWFYYSRGEVVRIIDGKREKSFFYKKR